MSYAARLAAAREAVEARRAPVLHRDEPSESADESAEIDYANGIEVERDLDFLFGRSKTITIATLIKTLGAKDFRIDRAQVAAVLVALDLADGDEL